MSAKQTVTFTHTCDYCKHEAFSETPYPPTNWYSFRTPGSRSETIVLTQSVASDRQAAIEVASVGGLSWCTRACLTTWVANRTRDIEEEQVYEHSSAPREN